MAIAVLVHADTVEPLLQTLPDVELAVLALPAGSSPAELTQALSPWSGATMHLLAHGELVPAALAVAATAPSDLIGLQCIDGAPKGSAYDAAQDLTRIDVPTLVLRSGTGPFGADESQALAGGIESAVSVVLDEGSTALMEWVTSFIEIAEGLHTAGTS